MKRTLDVRGGALQKSPVRAFPMEGTVTRRLQWECAPCTQRAARRPGLQRTAEEKVSDERAFAGPCEVLGSSLTGMGAMGGF